jgi:hypothetical protein
MLTQWGGFPDVVSKCDGAPEDEKEYREQYPYLGVLFDLEKETNVQKFKEIVLSLSQEHLNRINSPTLDALESILSEKIFKKVKKVSEYYWTPDKTRIQLNQGDGRALKALRNLNALSILKKLRFPFTLDHLILAYKTRQPKKVIQFFTEVVSVRYVFSINEIEENLEGPKHFIFDRKEFEEIRATEHFTFVDDLYLKSFDDSRPVREVADHMNLAIWKYAYQHPKSRPKWGDIVWVKGYLYRNEGIIFHDGEDLIELPGYVDDYGTIPPEFQILIRHPNNPKKIIQPEYWLEDSIRSVTHNNVVWLNYLPYIEEMKRNVGFTKGRPVFGGFTQDGDEVLHSITTWFRYKIPSFGDEKEEERMILISIAKEDLVYEFFSEEKLRKAMDKFFSASEEEIQPLDTFNEEFGITKFTQTPIGFPKKVDHHFYIYPYTDYRKEDKGDESDDDD